MHQEQKGDIPTENEKEIHREKDELGKEGNRIRQGFKRSVSELENQSKNSVEK